MQFFISILGLVGLLAIAWALSYHRKDVRPRVVLWGLTLQLIFAVIILRKDVWSFIGMAVLGMLVVTYLLLRRERPLSSEWYVTAGLVVTYLAAAALICWRVQTRAIFPLLILSLLALIANAWGRFFRPAQRYLAAGFVTLGICWFIANGLHGHVIFDALTKQVADFLNLSDYGARFLFGNLADPQHFFVGGDSVWPGFGFQFAFKVLPTIVFFGGFMGVLYHIGIMHRVIDAISRFMRWTIGTSGAETFSCSANIFVGQTEGPLLIKPFLGSMTQSELLTVMVGGFATIAGGVLAGYIAMGIPAGHLIAASVMSAPAALVIAKIIFPEKEHSETAGDVEFKEPPRRGNTIEAAANGITDGLKLAVNVGAMLLGFIALIAVIDVVLSWLDRLIDGTFMVWLNGVAGGRLPFDVGTRVEYIAGGMSPVVSEYTGIFPGSLQTLFGNLLRPVAWLMGVPWAEADKVGNLLGIKLSLNEFVAYGTLGGYIQQNVLSQRSIIIATYALCGFANFSSIGIQIGGISAVAPTRKADLAKLGLKAMFGGALASWLTATIAGMLL
jgi:CNT family concentrative nucleoside transporter